LHSLAIKSPVEEGLKTVNYMQIRSIWAFNIVQDFSPSDSVVSLLDNLEGKLVVLKYVKFQNVGRLTIFIEDNQGSAMLYKFRSLSCMEALWK
jgi:hypothetical protein